MDKRLFIVSNRLPISISGEGKNMAISKSSGGLVTAVNSYLSANQQSYSETYWVGVPGCTPGIWTDLSSQLPPSTYTYLPVMLYKEQYHKFYSGFSNSVVWPLFHYFPSFAEYDQDNFDHYITANEHFAEVILRNARPGDTVWIHDYHLLPLCEMLRRSMPELTICFFLHIPFPSYEVFRLLPRKWQEKLLTGMLGADLIGFHTIDYASHFLESIQMILGIDNDRHIIRYSNRLIKVDVFPISIDYDLFHNSFDDHDVQFRREELKNKLQHQKIIFSVDRLDYTKGVQNRLKAYDLFLKNNPEYTGKVIFILAIVPSRDTIPKYAERKRMIEELVSQINSRRGTIHWQPINYRYNFLDFKDMLALYTACDLALITPLRDGMNLVAKEFVASRKDKRGVLVLSEMAGAARELADAIIINPNDISEIADGIQNGLEMDIYEQQQRMHHMQQRVRNYDVNIWAEDILNELKNIRNKQQTFQIAFLDTASKGELLDKYRYSKNRLLLLDYDGTLVPFASDPEQATPGRELMQLLYQLSSVENNDVYLISGRSSDWLEKHFGSLPINLIAEHGARSKIRSMKWTTEVQTHSEWKEQVHNIMEMYVRRCPQSFIEEKDFSMVWHFRNSNKEQGRIRAIELKGELQEIIHNRHLQVLSGDKIVEVRNSGIDKGTAITKVLASKDYDFIFAAGDDRTDEDMFRMLLKKKHCFSIKVGTKASYARYNLMNPSMVVSLLTMMNHLSVGSIKQKELSLK